MFVYLDHVSADTEVSLLKLPSEQKKDAKPLRTEDVMKTEQTINEIHFTLPTVTYGFRLIYQS